MFLVFEGFQAQYVLILFLFSLKRSYLVTAKIIRDFNDFSSHAVQELGDSLHIRHNFWCLIK